MAHLAELVASAVRSRADELALLVRQQVDAELDRLVDKLVAEELHARANGSGPVALETPAEVSDDPAPPAAASPAPPGTKTCTRCGHTLPLTAFNLTGRGRHRAECRSCRRAYERERKAARRRTPPVEDAGEPRRPGHEPRLGALDLTLSDRERTEYLVEWAKLGVVELDDRGEFVVAPEWSTMVGAAFATS